MDSNDLTGSPAQYYASLYLSFVKFKLWQLRWQDWPDRPPEEPGHDESLLALLDAEEGGDVHGGGQGAPAHQAARPDLPRK